ncbi:MAG: hypothetical protein CTY35_01820 [Methylotenera sp.]|uniref:DUF4262 domain-containing protein n=1 Tax=Methylotenera sp. TaxID=2051956 RepID=UPI000D45C3D0|nr:DUF4262 domain-containing protein [Methylotenera sp.]PPC84368.1 MAG: hypothetical protein CTY38_02040 [Methylotenera sp.]PPD01010.1 MAG: hypothetical protein CTY35_01820 [Methylotenera sp.]
MAKKHDDDCECCRDGGLAFMEKNEALIKEFGFVVISTTTSSEDDGGDELAFAYTIGMADKGLPEIMMFGLPPRDMNHMLSNAVNRLISNKMVTGITNEEIAMCPIMVGEVDPDVAANYIIQANNRAGKDLPALQLVWPDQEGLFPWERGFNQKMAAYQHILFKQDKLSCRPH